METFCSKCNTEMVEAKLDSNGPIRVSRKLEKAGLLGVKSAGLSTVEAFVCPSCGLIDWYAAEPSKLY